LNYELNNNQEVDNGMLIKTKSDMSSLISDKNNSIISHNDEKNKREKDNNISFELKTNLHKNVINANENGNYINENNPKTIKILNEIENFGYKKEYVINCVKNNILCHASTIYYLLKNYGDID
jgi:hypothetical protein